MTTARASTAAPLSTRTIQPHGGVADAAAAVGEVARVVVVVTAVARAGAAKAEVAEGAPPVAGTAVERLVGQQLPSSGA